VNRHGKKKKSEEREGAGAAGETSFPFSFFFFLLSNQTRKLTLRLITRIHGVILQVSLGLAWESELQPVWP
jgi:hypothetical protein